MPQGTKLSDGTYTNHHMLYTGDCPFLLPLPKVSPQQFTVSDGGNTLTDAHGDEWTWNENQGRYELIRHYLGNPYTATWTFWNAPEGDDGISIKEYSGSPWGNTWECHHSKNAS